MVINNFMTLGQAAKATGKSKPTISKYIKNGKLSCISKNDSGYQIEPSELFRVFPPVNGNILQSLTHDLPAVDTHEKENIALLKQKIEMLESNIEMLQTDKSYLQGELSKTTTMLVDMREKSSEKPPERPKRLLGIFPRSSS